MKAVILFLSGLLIFAQSGYASDGAFDFLNMDANQGNLNLVKMRALEGTWILSGTECFSGVPAKVFANGVSGKTQAQVIFSNGKVATQTLVKYTDVEGAEEGVEAFDSGHDVQQDFRKSREAFIKKSASEVTCVVQSEGGYTVSGSTDEAGYIRSALRVMKSSCESVKVGKVNQDASKFEVRDNTLRLTQLKRVSSSGGVCPRNDRVVMVFSKAQPVASGAEGKSSVETSTDLSLPVEDVNLVDPSVVKPQEHGTAEHAPLETAVQGPSDQAQAPH